MTNNTHNLPSVSVIIPVYNDQTGLDKCLEALQQQTLSTDRFEVIVIDNGSDDPIRHLVTPELNVSIAHCGKKGSYAARNIGVKHSKADIIAFLDADCRPSKEWLKIGLNALTSHPETTIIGGEVKLTHSEKPTLIEQYQCITGFGQQANIENKKFTATANVFLWKRDFEIIGSFEEQLFSGGDREWSWRAERKNFSIVYCKEAVVYTPARKSLWAAIKQARRVTGGRRHFKQLGLVDNPVLEERLAPQRSAWESMSWLLNQKQIPLLRRIKILGMASLLKLVQIVEVLRLRTGLSPERC